MYSLLLAVTGGVWGRSQRDGPVGPGETGRDGAGGERKDSKSDPVTVSVRFVE